MAEEECMSRHAPESLQRSLQERALRTFQPEGDGQQTAPKLGSLQLWRAFPRDPNSPK